DLAAPHLEQIKRAFRKSLSRFAGRKRTVVGAGRGCSGVVHRNVARHKASRVSIAQADFEHRGRAEPQHFGVAMRKKLLRVLIVGEGLLKSRAGEPIPYTARKALQVQTLARCIDHSQQSLQPPPQILRPDQKRLGLILTRLDQTHRRARWQARKKVFAPSRIKFQSAIKFQHRTRILPSATIKAMCDYSLGPNRSARPAVIRSLSDEDRRRIPTLTAATKFREWDVCV